MNNNKLCENKKWELVNFCEFDKYAEKSYCAIHNVDSSKNLGDITKVDEENLSPFNMICGGSPCQDFSVAGKQKGSIWTCTVLWSNDISQVKTQFQAVGHINWGNTSAPTNGANSVNGTAHVSGTAKVTGDWGNKHPGTTLVGELGREMIVNPHTGRWYTVGDNGAEFTSIPQNAIVFNHVQTEELLSNGFTASRAIALASGTSPDISGKALVSGNAMVTGGISVKQAQKSVVSGGNTAKATSATNADTKATTSHTKEQLDSAKEDLNDTITDHAYSMQTDALDKLSADMSEDLDKWINTISSNMEEMTTAINDAVKNAGLSTAGTINAISSILRHYRLSDSEISQSGLTNITGYASGTNYVNKSGIYRVNEKGMESVFSKQYGTLTFLNQGDKVFDANFTKQLLDNSTIATQKNMPDYAGMAKAIEKNIQNIQNLSGNTYVNNFYIDGAQDTESILREIDKHLDKKIQAHDKKQVRDFKSLR